MTELVPYGDATPTYEQLTLDDLAAEIRREVAAAEDAHQSTIGHVVRAGLLLIEARRRQPHGQWGPWLTANFDGSEQTARAYMAVAKRQRSGDLAETSIVKALAAITVQRDADARREHLAANAAGHHQGSELADGDAEGPGWRLLLGDCTERANDLAPGSIAAIVTDPPYPDEHLPLWDHLGRLAARLLIPGGVLVARCGKFRLPDVLAALGDHLAYGWTYAEPLPGSNARFLGRKIANAYQPWIAYSNGPWPSGRIDWHPDLLAESPRTKARYVWEQKPAIAAELTATLAPAGSIVLDPFAGSGSYGEAALGVGCLWVGIEIDPAGHAQAAQRLTALRP